VTTSDTALSTASHHGLTLDQALVLTEFADDDEALATLTDTAVEDPDGLLHVASRIRQDRERQAGHEGLVAEHEGVGVTVLDQRPDSYSTTALGVPRILDALIDGADQALDPDRHISCPGHAVWIETSSWARPPSDLRLRRPADLRAPEPLRHRRGEQAARGSQGRTT
jgi:ParB family chromosome partitioning protein